MQKLKLSELPCETCHASKAVKRKHAGHLQRATYPLGLVHTDIQGPFREPDLDGNWYQMVLLGQNIFEIKQTRLFTQRELCEYVAQSEITFRLCFFRFA